MLLIELRKNRLNQGKTEETSLLLLLFEENREKQSKNELVLSRSTVEVPWHVRSYDPTNRHMTLTTLLFNIVFFE
jgi:hypothetical protein